MSESRANGRPCRARPRLDAYWPSCRLHAHGLSTFGVILGEWWSVSDRPDWLRATGRSRFLLTAPPLRLPGDRVEEARPAHARDCPGIALGAAGVAQRLPLSRITLRERPPAQSGPAGGASAAGSPVREFCGRTCWWRTSLFRHSTSLSARRFSNCSAACAANFRSRSF